MCITLCLNEGKENNNIFVFTSGAQICLTALILKEPCLKSVWTDPPSSNYDILKLKCDDEHLNSSRRIRNMNNCLDERRSVWFFFKNAFCTVISKGLLQWLNWKVDDPWVQHLSSHPSLTLRSRFHAFGHFPHCVEQELRPHWRKCSESLTDTGCSAQKKRLHSS